MRFLKYWLVRNAAHMEAQVSPEVPALEEEGREECKETLEARMVVDNCDQSELENLGTCPCLVTEGQELDKTLISKLQGHQPRRSPKRKRKIWTKGAILLIIGGVTNLLPGILSVIWTPFNLFMKERLNMRPGLPPYDWWVVPPDVVLRVYIFNITNSERFIKGEDSKLQLQEVGPIVYWEKLHHKNVTFHDNGTLTYVAHRWLEFQPDASKISLNDTLVVPNLSVLGIASYLHNASFFTKIGLSILLRRLHSQPLSHISVYDYLWNYRDPLLQLARTMAPFLVPVDNAGILSMVYLNFVDEVNVFIGPGNDRRFFTMDRFHGQPRFGFWRNDSCDTVEGATEGVAYMMGIRRNDSLRYFRKTLCRVAPITYTEDLVRDGIDSYRFELPDYFFDRSENEGSDCFAGEEGEPLISGLSDVSPCFFGFPLAASFPHFMNADPFLIDSVDGLTPQRDLHGSFVIVEPVTGTPMESCARIQSNLVIRKITGISDKLDKFSNLTIPMFWAEYHQTGLPWYITYLLYFAVNILPDLQSWLSFIMIVCGVGMLVGGILSLNSAQKSNRAKSYKFLDLTSSTSTSSAS